jgi:hypothetical protein
MRTGTEIGNSLIGKTGAEREALIWAAVVAKEYPSYTGVWREMLIRDVDAKGVPHTLLLRPAARPFELGTDSDPILMPMWPDTAQRVANLLNATLPSQKIVDQIWTNTDVHLPIGPPPGFKIPGPDMEATQSWIAHNAVIQKMLSNYRFGLMSGGKKDVVVGPGLDGSHVAIYSTPFSGTGSLRPSGVYPQYQPYSTIHWSKYSDYSHGIRLISRDAEIDGRSVDLAAIFLDPTLSALVSDQKNYYPSFPNTGLMPTMSSKYAVDYGIEEDSVEPAPAASGPAVDPTDPISAPSGILGWVAPTPADSRREMIGGGIGLTGGLLLQFSMPWLVAATIAGAGIARLMNRGGQ